MIAIVDILAAAVFGVAVATVFEGRWGVLIAVTPLLGALHGVLFLLPMPDAQTSMTAVQAVTAQLADPWLAVAAMVASGTGSVVAAFMLHQSRLAQQQPFWLPDMDGPNPGRRVRRSPDLMSRVERLPKSHTRRLVEEGYRGDEPQPVFTAPAEERIVAPKVDEARRAAETVSAEANKRQAVRRRTVLAGRVCAEAGVSVPCVIQNLSTTGAAVKISSSIALPRLISLIDVTNGIGHKAQVRWRFRDSMGVRFLASFDLKAPEGDEAVTLAHQWSAVRI